jgi:Protein kinase domain
MGADQSGLKSEEEFYKEYEEVRRESDVHLGSVIVYKSIKNPKLVLLVKDKLFTSEEDTITFVTKAKARAGIKGQNIAPLIEVVVCKDKKLCSTNYQVLLGYEYHERTLEKLLRQRKTYENEDAQSMAEEDAWGLLTDLTRAVMCYKDNGLNHGDIQPANAFVLNDKTLKLLDSCFLNDVESAFARRYRDLSYKSPFGPQAMSVLSLGPNYATYDREKNDVWALGITLLVSLNNDDFNIFYDWNGQDVNIDLIHAKIRKLQSQGYSAQLIKTLKLMLEKDEYKRIGLGELLRQANRGAEFESAPQYNDYHRGYNNPYPQQAPTQQYQAYGGDYYQPHQVSQNSYSSYSNGYYNSQPYNNPGNGFPSASEPQKSYGNFFSGLFEPKPTQSQPPVQENPRTYRDKPAGPYGQQTINQSARNQPQGISFPKYQSYRSPFVGQPEVGGEPQMNGQPQNWLSKWA